MSKKVEVDEKILRDTAQMLTNFSAMFMPVSGLTMIGIAGVSKSLMDIVGEPEENQILKPEEEWVNALTNYNIKMCGPLNSQIDKLKKDITLTQDKHDLLLKALVNIKKVCLPKTAEYIDEILKASKELKDVPVQS